MERKKSEGEELADEFALRKYMYYLSQIEIFSKGMFCFFLVMLLWCVYLLVTPKKNTPTPTTTPTPVLIK